MLSSLQSMPYSALIESPEHITTSMLAKRLEAMERDDLVERTLYQERPPRYGYHLTERGRALLPVLQQICRWANRHVPGTWTPPPEFMTRRGR
ncbi:MAG: helix-turn-helix domain-containing protein [Burkholderiaceae bacterium]